MLPKNDGVGLLKYEMPLGYHPNNIDCPAPNSMGS